MKINLSDYVDECGVTAAELAAELNIPEETISKWITKQQSATGVALVMETARRLKEMKAAAH